MQQTLPHFPENWKIEKKIGSGSFGTVYQASRTIGGYTEWAAIKHIPIPKSEEELQSIYETIGSRDERSIRRYIGETQKNLIEEYQQLRTFSGHTNIVSCNDIKIVERTDAPGCDIYIWMELLTCVSNRILDGQMNRDETIKLGIDICSALMRLQAKRVIHRDVKPQNIFINEDGDYKLGDFGSARHIQGTSTMLSIRGGTFDYLPPEVLLGRQADFTADVYSLGLVMYRLMNGNAMPFLKPGAGMNQQERETANTRRFGGEALQPPAYADKALAEIILKACAHVPADRWQSAAEMQEALLRLQNGQPVVPHVVPRQPEPAPKPKRKRAWVILLIVALLGVGGYLLCKEKGVDVQVVMGNWIERVRYALQEVKEKAEVDEAPDGKYHYQLFCYYCTVHQNRLLAVNGNMVVMTRRSTGDAENDPALESLRSFITMGDNWQDRETKYASYHDAVNDLLPFLDDGDCCWIRKWIYVTSPVPLEEEKDDIESWEFGSVFTYNGVRWQGLCVKTPEQLSPSKFYDPYGYTEEAYDLGITGNVGFAYLPTPIPEEMATPIPTPKPEYVTNISGNECTITGYNGSTEYLYIPDSIDGCKVTAIGENAFYYNVRIKKVTIPAGVRTIGKNAFYECDYLEEIDIASSVTRIDEGAFYGCSALKQVTIPGGNIGGSAFEACYALEKVTLQYGVTNIGPQAFASCWNITEITIPGTVQIIGPGAFTNCRRLNEVTIQEGVERIEYPAFKDCESLLRIHIPRSVNSIGTGFGDCIVMVKQGSYAHEWVETQKSYSNLYIGFE